MEANRSDGEENHLTKHEKDIGRLGGKRGGSASIANPSRDEGQESANLSLKTR